MSMSSNTHAAVKDQYEEYPYPYRDPQEEKERLLVCMLSRLDVVSHHCYAGQQDFHDFHVLDAGGGTGDGAIFWAEQLRDKPGARVTYIDMSAESRRIAEERAKVRQLDNIEWITGSLLDLPTMGVDPVDFVDCSGVLHHLANPDAGLQSLKSVLKPDGAMNIMVYGTYGRAGVYKMQELMRLVNENSSDKAAMVDLTKKTLATLPAQNWFSVGQKHVWPFSDLEDDAGLYDLFLHAQDCSYTITQIYDWLARCDLSMIAPPGTGASEHLFYKPETFVRDPELLKKIKAKPEPVQHAIAEIMCGRLTKHNFFVGHQGRSRFTFDLENDRDLIPYGNTTIPDALPQLAAAFADNIGAVIPLVSKRYPDIAVPVQATQVAAAILQRIDGTTSVCDIYMQLSSQIDEAAFMREFKTLFTAFNAATLLYLRAPNITPYPSVESYEQHVKTLYGLG